MRRSDLMLLTLAMLLAPAGPVAGEEDEAILAELRERLTALEREIDDLAASRDHATPLDVHRAELMRAIVHDVLADADIRSNLLGQSLTAGHDGSFFIASADGNFRLAIEGRMQTRYVYNFQSRPRDVFDQDGEIIGRGERHRSGFENRRMQLAFSGHVIDPSWGYKVQGDFARNSGTFTLLDAFVDKTFHNGWMLRIGQFRHVFLREDSTSSGRQLAVERSLLNRRFAQNRGQGIELRASAGDRLRWSAAFTEGIAATIGDAGRGRSTPFDDRTTEFALTGRVDYLAVGDAPSAWRQHREFTSWPGEPFAVFLGAAGHWQRDEYGTPDDVTEMFRWTVDAMAKFGGAGAFVAIIGNHESTKAGSGAGESVDQLGLVTQGSVFIVDDRWEAFARYEWGSTDGMGKDLSVITIGLNRYFARHRIKWTSDVGIGINEVAPFWSTAGAGYRADRTGESGQLVVRSQLQLDF